MPTQHYRSASGLRIRRRTVRLDYAAGLGFLARQLDARRGAYFSSGVEDPDRYSRWEFGFADPPLEIVGRGRGLTLAALNRRGEILLALLAPRLAGRGVAIAERETRRIVLAVAPAAGRFAEEERSRQPSAFTVLRRIARVFQDGRGRCDDRFLGLYGAFGYDLIFQFEDLPQRRARPAEAVDLHLYLPDRIYVLDRRLETAYRHDYDFAQGAASTAGLPRKTADFAPPPRAPRADTAIAADVSAADYAATVETVRRHLAAGDAFEVVLSRTFSARCSAPPSRLFAALRQVSPSPYEFFLRLGADESLLGASPEMFVRVDGDGRNGRRVETCPISGTIRRAGEPMADAERIRELLNSAKDEAELTMCTDVDRNDKARICVPGSVRLLARRLIERYAGLFHTVDHVEGRLRRGFDGFDAFLSHVWAVTLTGAPKRKAVDIIEALEAQPRRWYGGAVGGFPFDGSVNTGITIRTIHLESGVARYRAGASIVYDSKGDEEAAETETKATAFRRVLAAMAPARAAAASALVPRSAAPRELRVIMIDNEDSFVHTLADYFRQTGAAVTTHRWGLPLAALLATRPDLVVHSPGPGRPRDFGVPELVRALAAKGVAQFGVCLGLQGMAEAFGGELAVLPEPRHGKSWHVLHDGGGLFAGLPSQLAVGAYHSLHAPAASLPPALAVTGRTEAGLVMALRHRQLPLAAVQFHPESILSLGGGHGLTLIANAMALLAPRAAAARVRAV